MVKHMMLAALMCMMVLGPGGADPPPTAGNLDTGEGPDAETDEGTRAVTAPLAAPVVSTASVGSGGVEAVHEGQDSPGRIQSTGAMTTPQSGNDICKHCQAAFPLRSLKKHQRGCRKMTAVKTRWEVCRCCFPGCSGEGNTHSSDRYSML